MKRWRWILSLMVLVTCAAVVIATVACSSPSLIGGSSPWCIPDRLFSNAEEAPEATEALPHGPDLRVVVYNIRSGLGASGRASASDMVRNLRGIAAAIAQNGKALPDVVGLNEVDFRSRRTGFVDQAAFIAQELRRYGVEYTVVRGPAWQRTERGREILYGNALLVRHPVVSSGACLFDDLRACGGIKPPPELRLPSNDGLWSWLSNEPRSVVVADFQWGAQGTVRAVLTHLDPYSASVREAQAAQIVQHLENVDHPVVLLGDINAVPTRLTVERRWFAADRTHDVLTSGRLSDVRRDLAGDDETRWLQWATYPAEQPRWPIDAVLASPSLVARRMERLPAVLSDHLGLVATLSLVRHPQAAEARWVAHARRRHARLLRIVSCDLPAHGTSALLRWLVDRRPSAQ